MKEETNQSEIILYKTDDGRIKVDTIFQNETIWLNQVQMSELFGVERSVITKHLKNIFVDNELDENSVCAKFAHTAADGKNYQTKYYNLDAIIAVGYRVNSKRATQFRIWAINILKEYIIKGFAMDDERLKKAGRWDYFDEWLARIRDIRASNVFIRKSGIFTLLQLITIRIPNRHRTSLKKFRTKCYGLLPEKPLQN